MNKENRELKDIDSVNEVKFIVRGLHLMRMDNTLDMKFKTPSFINFFHLWKFYKRRNLIKRICELGGVITGSRVLSNSFINGKQIISRDINNSDWDILVTEENLYKITSDIEFKERSIIDPPGSDGALTKKLTHRIIYPDSYGNGSCDIDLIVVKQLPQVHKVGQYLFADPIYIIEEKMKSDKKTDIIEIFWKFRDLVQ